MMQISLRPELAKFIDDQVKTGRYGTADDAVNAAIAKVQMDEQLLAKDLDDDDVAAIEEGLSQLNRGEGRSLDSLRAEFLPH
jgi:putative addiction module CopG family antidote